MPAAQGGNGEILILMDSAKWEGQLGDTIRHIFREEMKGLPRPEPLFDAKFVLPRQFNSTLKKAKNIVFITVLDDDSRDSRRLKGYFTPQSLKQIQEDTTRFMYSKRDEFARGQIVMHLFARDEQVLMNRLSDSKQRIRDFWEQQEQERVEEEVLRRTQKKLEKQLADSFYFNMKIPFGYEIALLKEDFIWLRLLDSKVDKSLFVYFEPYRDAAIFQPDKLIGFRDIIGKKYIYGSDESNSYMVTETLLPPYVESINYDGIYAMKMQGLWRLENKSMGGPFTSYTLVDESRNRICHVEGFIYAPGKDKRDPMVEIQTILRTFRIIPKQN